VPYTPLGALLGFVPLPVAYLFVLGLVAVVYATAMEIAKKIFFAKTRF
jgi:hypothetical protein